MNDMVILKSKSSGLLPKKQGKAAPRKLSSCADWMRDRLVAKPDLTLDEISAELASAHGLSVHRASIGRWRHRLGLSHMTNSARQ